MRHSLTPLALCLALAACGEGPPVAPAPVAAEPAGDVGPGPAREVLRLEPDGAGGLAVDGTVSTPEARQVLMDEIARRWPGAAVRADVTVDPAAPAAWLPEAVAMMPFIAQAMDGGLVVLAQPGPAGGGTLAISGRVPDAETRDRLAADAAATLAPPFVLRSGLAVGEADGLTVGAAEGETEVVAGDDEAELAAAALRSALADTGIAFEAGAAEFAAGTDRALVAAASVLASHPEVGVQVSAPGGSTGSDALDRALAARRGEAVVRAFVAGGVEEARVSVAPAGETPSTVVITLTVDA
jgi:outer membrane protein OmpA-like peptidoglycan-associated protein